MTDAMQYYLKVIVVILVSLPTFKPEAAINSNSEIQ